MTANRELFVKRGRAGAVLGPKYYLRWRTRCGRAAVARAGGCELATWWYALRRAGNRWWSIESRPDGLPRRYRTRAAAVRVVVKYLESLQRRTA